MDTRTIKKPAWLKFSIPGGKEYTYIKDILTKRNLHTVCTEARCPNIGHCFSCGTATFLILGNICTRNCRYCAIDNGIPSSPDINEPQNIAESVKLMKLNYAVITSVTRDDLPDGGAGYFAKTISLIHKLSPECRVEPLIPDFKQNMKSSLNTIIENRPFIINHNIEVTKNMYTELRPMGNYSLSLKIIEEISKTTIPAKSGLMIGFGENIKDIHETLKDLLNAGCSYLTIGQYLKSSKHGFNVVKYYEPAEFDDLNEYASSLGFKKVLSGPLVRSSYHAADL